jgi:hypothetical protein
MNTIQMKFTDNVNTIIDMKVMLGMLNILPLVQIESWNKYQKLYSNALSVVNDECHCDNR